MEHVRTVKNTNNEAEKDIVIAKYAPSVNRFEETFYPTKFLRAASTLTVVFYLRFGHHNKSSHRQDHKNHPNQRNDHKQQVLWSPPSLHFSFSSVSSPENVPVLSQWLFSWPFPTDVEFSFPSSLER